MKYRDFFLQFEGQWNTWSVAYDFSDPEKPKEPENPHMIHVIEYSALTEAQAEIERLRSKLVHRHIVGKAYPATRETIDTLAGELDELKSELKAANFIIAVLQNPDDDEQALTATEEGEE